MTQENLKVDADLFSLMAEGNGKMTIMNRDAYLEDAKTKPMLFGIEHIEESMNLEEGERFLYVESITGPLAARGTLFAINENNEVTKSMVIWMS